ncbi:MAG: hypothetical protein IKS39_11905 [Clostridia bacterium]|nr:hypothetical protein [Clostridia bacterium]
MSLLKKCAGLLLTVIICFSLSACCVKHEWKAPDCTTPRTCAKCGKTAGKPYGHLWIEADCTSPKLCSVCGKTEGEPLGHKWKDADCTTPKTCTRCKVTQGKPQHKFGEWKPVDTEKLGYKEKRICSVCKEEETRNMPRSKPQKKHVLTNSGMQMSVREFAEYLINYLPEGCYITDFYEDGFNIQGDAYATVSIDKNGNYKDMISFYGTSVNGEEDIILLTPYLARAIDPYADESAFTRAQRDVKEGFSSGDNGVYASASDLDTVVCNLLYVPSRNDHPVLIFATMKFARG